jgi:hypothetical protein
MTPCDDYQNQLLDHLYGLLDGPEREALVEHLDGCASCREALAAAEAQQALLAAAAKTRFPEVRFEPPAVPVAASQPISVPFVQPPRPARRNWRRWAVAAAVLLALGGLGTLFGSWYQDHSELLYARASVEDEISSTRRQADQAHAEFDDAVHERDAKWTAEQAERARAAKEMREIQDEILKAEKAWKAEINQVQEQAAKRQLKITVVGPKTVEAGARNDYRIETRRPIPPAPGGFSLPGTPVPPPAPPDAGKEIPAKVVATVLDPKTRKVYYEKAIASTGNCLFTLPRDLPVKPNTQLALEVTARADSGAEAKVTERLPLLGKLYLTHLAIDRPMYRPGEVVRFRSLTLERFSLRPAQEDFALVYRITDPSGAESFLLAGRALLTKGKGQAVLRGPNGKELRGIGAGEFVIPPTAPGGEYTLTVSDALSRFPPEQRKFLVNRYQAPRLNKELDFTRKSYGPGDEVVASCKVSRVENKNKPVADQPVVATVTVDGKQITKENLRTDAKGNVPPIRFRLPGQLERGQGTLSVQFTDGANHETIVRPIPIVLKKLFVDFYPEGGDLVAGVPNRVYFQARTTLNKPAELRGQIVDGTGKVVVAAATLNDDKEPGVNQGMGLFQFTPQAGQSYELKIATPAGIEGRYPLPAVQPDGVVLAIPGGVVKKTIDVTLYTGRTQRRLLVGAYCRGRVLEHTKVTVKPGQPAHVRLTPSEEVGGVYRVTVFEERGGDRPQLVPVAERLIYRQPTRQLNLAAHTDKRSYSPGDRVGITFTARDEQEKKVPAVALVGIVDQSIIKLADDKTARSMPAHFFLTTEVKKPEDLEYADFLLSNHPKAAQALDLLLGTQGWRRFAEQDPAHFRRKQKDDAERLLFANGQSRPAALDSLKTVLARVDARYLPQYQEKQAELAKKEADLDQKQEQCNKQMAVLGIKVQNKQAAVGPAEAALRHANVELRTAEDRLHEHTQQLIRAGLIGLACLLLVVALIGFVLGLLRASQGERRAAPYLLAGLCSLVLLFLGGAAGLFYQHSKNAAQQERELAAAGATERNALRHGSGAFPGPNFMPMAPGGGTGVPKMAPRGKENAEKRGDDKAAPEPAQLKDLAKFPDRPDVRTGLKNLDEEKAQQKLDKDRGQPEELAVPKLEAPLIGRDDFKGKEKPVFEPQNVAAQLALPPPIPAQGLNLPVEQPGQVRFAQPFGAVPPLGTVPPGGMPGPVGGPMPGFVPPAGLGGQIGGAFGGLAGGQMAGGIGGGLGGVNPGGGIGGGMMGMAGWMPPQAERELRKQGKYVTIAQLRVGRGPVTAGLEPLVVREYAHHHQRSSDGLRHDWAETVYWQPALILPNGEAKVSFDLPDSVTRFQVVAWAHTSDGRLGAVTDEFASRLPFSIEPKVPTEVTNTDKIVIPVTLANDTATKRSVSLKASGTNLTLSGSASLGVPVAAEGRRRKLFTFRPSTASGEAKVRFDGRCAPFATDSVERSFKIVPEGFPFVGSRSDVLEGTTTQTITLPEHWIKGTLKLQAQVFPSTLADLQKGLEAMLREPGGCFEQTSSSNYPNVMILSYLKESDQARPDVEKRARQLLASGYRQLTGFECRDPQQPKRRGYEWFGGTAPPHEALTAYGLLEFRDMAAFQQVDPAMLERTRKYLLAQRDGKGGFKRNPRALDSFGRAPEQITNAYIVWALVEAGTKANLDTELDALAKQAKDSNDPYFLALVGNSFIGSGRTKAGVEVLKRLAGLQKADGHLEGTQTSITGSGGRDLQIETTALATLAWLKANRPAEFNSNVQKAAGWIGKQRGGFGGFGSTQSTILALKALIAFTKDNRRTASAGQLRLYVNNHKQGKEWVAATSFPAGTQDAIVVQLPREDFLKPGKNTIRVEMTGKNTFPYTLSWSYNTLKPANAEGCPVHLTTKLDRNHAAEGETVHLTAQVKNQSGKGQGMTVAILGLPGGLEVPPDFKQLKEMVRLRDNDTKPGLISFYELRGRELVLYWRDLAPDQKIAVSVDLVCHIPGEYRGPASRAYLYYNADRKFWTEPLSIAIRPAGGE